MDGASTIVEAAAGIARPDFILVNDGDLGYAKVRLDEQSLAFAIANITQVHGLPHARRRHGLRVGHDPRRRDARPATT